MIYLASDHAGFELKNEMISFLKEIGQKYEDLGPFSYDQLDDYPDYIIPAAKRVAEDSNNRGIVIGGSGQGEAVAANKVKGIRAALYYGGPKDIVVLSRTHNNSNVLSLGARFLSIEQTKEVVRLWMETSFTKEERHCRRVNKIKEYEEKNKKT